MRARRRAGTTRRPGRLPTAARSATRDRGKRASKPAPAPWELRAPQHRWSTPVVWSRTQRSRSPPRRRAPFARAHPRSSRADLRTQRRRPSSRCPRAAPESRPRPAPAAPHGSGDRNAAGARPAKRPEPRARQGRDLPLLRGTASPPRTAVGSASHLPFRERAGDPVDRRRSRLRAVTRPASGTRRCESVRAFRRSDLAPPRAIVRSAGWCRTFPPSAGSRRCCAPDRRD